jgi:hypothetical protein
MDEKKLKKNLFIEKKTSLKINKENIDQQK